VAQRRAQREQFVLPKSEPAGIVGWNEARMGTGVPIVDERV